MKFEEIKRIDRGPDYNVYANSISNYYDSTSLLDMGSYIMLISLYMKKFDEVYGTDFGLMADTESLLYYVGDCDYSDFLCESIYVYESEAQDCFIRTAEKYGFECCIYEFMDSGSEIKESDNPEVELTVKLLEETDKADDAWRIIINDCQEILLENAFYLESGCIIIIRNQELGLYKGICSKYKDLIEKHLGKERIEIDQTIENLSYPVLYYCILENGYAAGYYYICLVIGCDGYESCGFTHLNISWLINCFILSELFKDFKEKLACVLSDTKGVLENGSNK